MKLAALPLAALALATLTPLSAFGFVSSSTSGGDAIRWASRSVPFSLQEDGSADLDFDAVENAVLDSFAEWEAPTCSDLSFDYDGVTDTWDVGPDGENIVLFRQDWRSASQDTIGLTTVTFCESRGGDICPFAGAIVNADIEMNEENFTFSLDTHAGDPTADFENTLVHEIGHFLGLDHTEVRDATMYPQALMGETRQRTLHQDDIDGLCYTYPKGATSPTEAAGTDDVVCSAVPGGPASSGGLLMLVGVAALGLRRQRKHY